jgi:hypothetical protein
MPAPEVVGAMPRIEIPGEIGRRHLADGARHQDLFDSAVLRRIAVVERDDDRAAGLLFRVENGLALRLVDAERLFGHHVDAALQALDDVFAVIAVHRRDHQEIRLGLIHHLVEIAEGRTRDADQPLRGFGAQRVDVAQPDEFGDVAVLLRDRTSPHAGAAIAGADNRVTAFLRLGADAGSGQAHADGRAADRGHELAATDSFDAAHRYPSDAVTRSGRDSAAGVAARQEVTRSPCAALNEADGR